MLMGKMRMENEGKKYECLLRDPSQKEIFWHVKVEKITKEEAESLFTTTTIRCFLDRTAQDMLNKIKKYLKLEGNVKKRKW